MTVVAEIVGINAAMGHAVIDLARDRNAYGNACSGHFWPVSGGAGGYTC